MQCQEAVREQKAAHCKDLSNEKELNQNQHIAMQIAIKVKQEVIEKLKG